MSSLFLRRSIVGTESTLRRATRPVVEAMEPRQLLTVVTGESPIVTTFGTSQGAEVISSRDMQSIGALALNNLATDIVAVGQTQSIGGHKVATISEFDATNGKPVDSFGTHGATLFDINAAGDTFATGVQIAPNGNIFACGTETATPGGLSSAWIASFTPAGKLNLGFNKIGYETFTDNTSADYSANGLLLQPTTNKIILIGNSYSPATWTGGATVAQFLPGGGLDKSFNSTGYFATNPGANKDEFATGGIFNPSGGLYLSGTQFTVTTVAGKKSFSSSMADVMSIKPGGGFNTSFGNQGRFLSSWSPSLKYSWANSLTLDLRNKYLDIGGTVSNGYNSFGTNLPYGAPTNGLLPAVQSNFAAERLLPSGKYDLTFNKIGYESFSFGTNWRAGANTIHADLNGGITLSGGAGIGSGNSSQAVARLMNDGTLNTHFNATGLFTQPITGYSTGILADAFVPHYNELKFQDYYYDFHGGTAFQNSLHSKALLGEFQFRYDPTNFKTSPAVPTFGTNGIATYHLRDVTDGTSIDYTPTKQLVIGGDTAFNGKFKYGFLAEYTPLGKPIMSFGTNGSTMFSFSSNGDTIVSAIRTNGLGDILVAGDYTSNGTTFGYVADYTSKGFLNKSFNETGWRSFNWGDVSGISGLAIEPTTNKIDISGGYFSASTLGGGATFARLLSNGAYDTGFNSTGYMFTNPGFGVAEFAGPIVMRPGGGFYSAGARMTFGLVNFVPVLLSSQMEGFAVKSNGTLDTTFGTGGRALLTVPNYKYAFATSLAVDPRTGFLVLGGTASNGLLDFGTPIPIGAAGGLFPPATSAVFLASRWTLAGKSDKTFNTNGYELVNFGAGWLAGASSVGVFQDGSILLAGGADLNHTGSRIARVRLLPAGGLDTRFPGNGIFVQQIPGRSAGPFDYIIVPHYNASDVLDYFFGFYTGHSKLDAALSDLLLGTDFLCDF